MGSVSSPIYGRDNVKECRVFGKHQPQGGRAASPDELANLRQWIRSAQLLEEFLDGSKAGSNAANETISKVIIELIHGKPMRITPWGEEKIHLVDGGGAVRILRQAELRSFLNTL